MKLDIKKIGLILAGTIFVFSGAFAQEQLPAPVKPGEEGEKDVTFKRLKINNELKGQQVTIELNKNTGEAAKIDVQKGSETKEIPQGKFETLDIMIKDAKGQLRERLKELKFRCKENKKKCRGIILQKIRDIKKDLKDKNISITAEEEGDTLVINIKGGSEGMKEQGAAERE